jgi:hypothetical protein
MADDVRGDDFRAKKPFGARQPDHELPDPYALRSPEPDGYLARDEERKNISCAASGSLCVLFSG